MTDKPEFTPFIAISKSGVWQRSLDPASIWAVNPLRAEHGYACWQGNLMLGDVMAVITEPPVERSSLPAKDGEWIYQVRLQLRCIEGFDKGNQVLFVTRSQGSLNRTLSLIDEITQRARSHNEAIVPHVKLGIDHYDHPTYGSIFAPVFVVQYWTTLTGEREA